MFGALGTAPAATSLVFVSSPAAENGLATSLALKKKLVSVRGTRGLRKTDMVYNDLLPNVEVDPETYEVRLDGEVITSEPATNLPLAQRYFLF